MSVADMLRPAVVALLGKEPPIAVRFWDESLLGSPSSTTIMLRSAEALRRLLWSPNELGFGRAYVAGELDIAGDVFEALALRDMLARPEEPLRFRLGRAAWLHILRAASMVRALGPPLPPPPEEARPRGRRHSLRRDSEVVGHHYDVSNRFYRLVLGETMTYSCAYFVRPDVSLDDAQRAKHELVCRKLGLEAGMRLLDVGCGWGGLAMHAAQHHGTHAVGITLSQPQYDLARKRVAEAGLADRVDIRLQDYRAVDDGPYDAVASVGMFEHVGRAQMDRYFEVLFALLAPGGRLLNHAISRPYTRGGRSRFDDRSFIARYVFPDGELHPVGTVVSVMEQHGLEVRDVESLREHYARTLRRWVGNLEDSWGDAVEAAGRTRARIWRLYMAASALGFKAGRIAIHQVLGVKPARGASGMPLTRAPYLVS